MCAGRRSHDGGNAPAVEYESDHHTLVQGRLWARTRRMARARDPRREEAFTGLPEVGGA